MPPFTEHFFDPTTATTASIRDPPAGEPGTDARSPRTSRRELPLLSPFEMANESPTRPSSAKVAARVLRGAISRHVRRESIRRSARAPSRRCCSPSRPSSRRPPSSIRTRASTTPSCEARPRSAPPRSAAWRRSTIRRGAIARAVIRARCARAHSRNSRTSATPRSARRATAAIPANADPRYYDLGLCGPLRTDLTGQAPNIAACSARRPCATSRRSACFSTTASSIGSRTWCAFTPSAIRHPQKWYPRDANGAALKFDDLPAKYRGNVDQAPPFGEYPGERPRLNDADVHDIVAFLSALSDSYHADETPASQKSVTGISH